MSKAMDRLSKVVEEDLRHAVYDLTFNVEALSVEVSDFEENTESKVGHGLDDEVGEMVDAINEAIAAFKDLNKHAAGLAKEVAKLADEAYADEATK